MLVASLGRRSTALPSCLGVGQANIRALSNVEYRRLVLERPKEDVVKVRRVTSTGGDEYHRRELVEKRRGKNEKREDKDATRRERFQKRESARGMLRKMVEEEQDGVDKDETSESAETRRQDVQEELPKKMKEANQDQGDNHSRPAQTTSLFDQLFPDLSEESSKAPQQQQATPQSDIPPLPVKPLPREALQNGPTKRIASRRTNKINNALDETTVVVLKNASHTLVEDDFRRLVPRGKHIEGWTMEEGDILHIIPTRDLTSLAPRGSYYLLFSSSRSAYAYQRHAHDVHRMVASHTPSSILSPIPPPPGYMIEGIDAHDAMRTFSLVPPTQSLHLSQLKPPLAPTIESILRSGGYPALLNREKRMPFEARLTLEGPQLPLRHIQHILIKSAQDRGVGWSGSDDGPPQLTKWELPVDNESAPFIANASEDVAQMETESDNDNAMTETTDGMRMRRHDHRRRQPQLVYIVGFHTSRALQSFVHFWHRRPMEWKNVRKHDDEDEDMAPIAHVEVLW